MRVRISFFLLFFLYYSSNLFASTGYKLGLCNYKFGRINIFNSEMCFAKYNIIDLFKKDSIPNQSIIFPRIVNGECINLDWKPIANFNNELFPSAIISSAACYDTYINNIFLSIKNPLGFQFISSRNNILIKWEVESIDKSFFDKITGYYTYVESGKTVNLQVDIPWNYRALANNITPTPLTVYFRLYDNEGNKVEKLMVITMRGINECVNRYKDQDLNFELSAYVQENSPSINYILKDAVNTKIIDAFINYQNSDSNAVDKEVAAIWRVMHEQGFAYSTTNPTNSSLNDYKDSLFSQSVRTFQDAFNTKQINALDGTIVFASILKKIGLNPLIIMVPGHYFLGYYVNKTSIHYLETTMLPNTGIYKNGHFINLLVNAKTSVEKNKAFTKLFLLARSEGDLEFNKTDTSKRMIIDISSCRRFISPLPIYN